MPTTCQLSTNTPAFYARKLYALLQEPTDQNFNDALFSALQQAVPELNDAAGWWQAQGQTVQNIGSSSDRVNLHEKDLPSTIEVRHPISGQSQTLDVVDRRSVEERVANICAARDAIAVSNNPDETLKRLFWWCWRFYPDCREGKETALLNPAHRILPDCPIPSYNSTVSAITGAMFPPDWENSEAKKPYLLLFTFSPVQEFIKASRKFSDFWSGSYMLHYLSARLCWCIAQKYGPDAVITPSLWDQEIIDALLAQTYPEFAEELKQKGRNPVDLFNEAQSRSLSTAGFPNTITALVPGKENAIALGQALQNELRDIWRDIANQVREHIKHRVMNLLSSGGFDKTWQKLKNLFPETYEKELRQLQQPGCWEWNKLWEAQIDNTWQPYFVAVPLGHPETEAICANSNDQDWIDRQTAIAQPRTPTPTEAEQQAYDQLNVGINVGAWWGSLQARLGQSMQAVKNTRRWQIPTAPGERSSLSGQFSGLHPRLHYADRFKHGRGMAAGSIRLFWYVMSLAYKGLFDGSERLNALELTKRMAWQYGGVAESLGIPIEGDEEDFGKLIRFPNLSSLAAAHFASRHPEIIDGYWRILRSSIQRHKDLTSEQHDKFCSVTHRAFQVNGADNAIRNLSSKAGNHDYNGVMFSSKWLIEDMDLSENKNIPKDKESKQKTIQAIRDCVLNAHQDKGFGDSSPADWWVLVLADGDSMGKYVSGNSLQNYDGYLLKDLVNRERIKDDKIWNNFLQTKKRMGPATHVGLNRALLDFSNRLVPHLAEHRYCGKVIYSGGDDVLVALPLADLPGFLRSLRAAWCGGQDPGNEFEHTGNNLEEPTDQACGYWRPVAGQGTAHLPNRPLFTMGEGATMSMGIVIAHKSVPLPTVLENLWEAESEKAKKLLGGKPSNLEETIRPKDGLCFRIIYGSGNVREALMKGHLLDAWWEIVQHHDCARFDLSPVFNRLAEELPKHVAVTEHHQLCCQAAKAILLRREDQLPESLQTSILSWLSQWEAWAWAAQQTADDRNENALGTELKDLADLLRFTAFWITRRRQELSWVDDLVDKEFPETKSQEVSYA